MSEGLFTTDTLSSGRARARFRDALGGSGSHAGPGGPDHAPRRPGRPARRRPGIDFREAARQAVPLSHVNIVALYDIGYGEWLPILLFRNTRIPNFSTEIIAHEGPFHPDDVIVLVEQVAAALDYAALRDLFHLALSPAAITVDYGGQVLVSDFGIGRVLERYLADGRREVAIPRARADDRSGGRCPVRRLLSRR